VTDVEFTDLDPEDQVREFAGTVLEGREPCAEPWDGFVWIEAADPGGSSSELVMLRTGERPFFVDIAYHSEEAADMGLDLLDTFNADDDDQGAFVATFDRAEDAFRIEFHYGEDAEKWKRGMGVDLAEKVRPV